MAVMSVSCNNEKTEPSTDAKTGSVSTNVTLPYTAAYSSSFEMGNFAYAVTILKCSWKDWGNNTMDNMKDWVTDTVLAMHSDNSVITGADSLITR